MFLNHNDEILRYAVKMTRSKQNFRKIITAVKKIKNLSICAFEKKIFYQQIDYDKKLKNIVSAR